MCLWFSLSGWLAGSIGSRSHPPPVLRWLAFSGALHVAVALAAIIWRKRLLEAEIMLLLAGGVACFNASGPGALNLLVVAQVLVFLVQSKVWKSLFTLIYQPTMVIVNLVIGVFQGFLTSLAIFLGLVFAWEFLKSVAEAFGMISAILAAFVGVTLALECPKSDRGLLLFLVGIIALFWF